MLTPQEVSSHAFPKAVMGGYNMASVDEFLDELTADYTALYKENAALKAKLKVLVEKVEDYRATEDSMRATLLAAQKMADSIVHEAEAKREQVLAQAEESGRRRIGELQSAEEESRQRLAAGQKSLQDFIADSRSVLERELRYLDQLPQLPVEQPAPTPAQSAEQQKAAVGAIEEKILANYDEPASAPEQPAPEDGDAQAPAPEADAAPAPAAAAEDAEEDEDLNVNPFTGERDDEPTRRLNLRELKFGRNYSGATDEDDE
jgi:DivIVA domain